METTVPTPHSVDATISRMRKLQSARRERNGDVMAGVLSAYVTTPRDALLAKELDNLIDGFLSAQEAAEQDASRQVGRLREGRALTVTGASGAGKTRTLERHFFKREEFAGYGDRDSDCILVSVSTPSPCTLRLLGMEVLKALGYETTRKLEENVVWDMVQNHLAVRGVCFLHIDELQHVLQSRNPVEVAKVRDTLKRLMQNKAWPVWLILSGLPEIGNLFAGDEQVWRRSRQIFFENLTLEKDTALVRHLITSYGKDKASLSVASVTTDALIGRLIHAGIGRFGIVIEIIQDAINEALLGEADELRLEHFASAYAARTGCLPEANVFTAANDWWLLNPRDAPLHEECPEDPEVKVRAPRDRRNR